MRRNILVTGSYVAGAMLGFLASGTHDAVTTVWPPTGIAVAALLLAGYRVWPAIAVGAVAANLLNGTGPATAALFAIGNTLAPVVAVSIMRRFRIQPGLARLSDVTALFGSAFVAMTISATVGVGALALTGTPVMFRTWTIWWVGDALGVVLFAPPILTTLRNDGLLRLRWKTAVATLGVLAVATTGALVTDSPIGYAVVPLAMAIAVVLEQQGAALAILVLTVLDVTHLLSLDPSSATLDADLAAMQGVNATLAFILLALAAIVAERRRAQRDLEAAAHDLERRVEERTAELSATNARLEREIADRRATEEALRSSEVRLSQAQRLAHIGSFQWDAATDTNDWSDELYQIYGLDPAAGPPGLDAYIDFVRADVRDEVRAKIEEGIARGGSFSHEYPVVLHDGSRRWVHAYIEVMSGPEGSLAGLRGTCQDVTDRKEAEAALRWSERRFRALLESAPDAVIVVEPTGKIVLTNEQASNLFGYTADEMLGRSVEMLLPTELRRAHAEHRDLFNAQPARRPMGEGRELYAERKDGTSVAVDISLSPVETDNGFLVFALVRDASERRRVEDALRGALEREREAAEDLRKLDRAKNAFLSAVSHELRTPLTAIIGFAELLEEPLIRSSPERTDDLIGRVRVSATRLNDLLGDLLDLDRLHRGIVTPRRRVVQLRSMVARAVGGVDLGAHPLRLWVEDAVVQVDPAQTERIIENLLSNAVRYTPDGTEVRLTARAATNGGMRLEVADEGPGVPKDLWPTIFEPFVRGDTGTFTQGTGIGLALVDRFARLHGGSAEVRDRAGGGASFLVTLQGADAPAAREEGADAA